MAEQDLDDPDVHAPLEHVRGEAVTQRVGRKSALKPQALRTWMNGARAVASGK